MERTTVEQIRYAVTSALGWMEDAEEAFGRYADGSTAVPAHDEELGEKISTAVQDVSRLHDQMVSLARGDDPNFVCAEEHRGRVEPSSATSVPRPVAARQGGGREWRATGSAT